MPACRFLKGVNAGIAKLNAGGRFQRVGFNRTAAGEANAELPTINAIESLLQLDQALIILEIKVIPYRGLLIHLNSVVVPKDLPHLLLEVMSQICQPRMSHRSSV